MRSSNAPSAWLVAPVGVALLLANVVVWAAAILLFRDHPGLLSAGLLAYGLGLRHALDADHLAVIDNVVRSSIDAPRRSAMTGLWFSLGHSTVVGLACLATAGVAVAWRSHLQAWQQAGETYGPLVSAVVLLAVALMNGRALSRLAKGAPARPARWLARYARGWTVFPLGFVMGLGFDTAGEVAVLALAAAHASQGLPLSLALVFPLLFAAAMTLVDTADSALMLRAYRWAADQPGRRHLLNLSLTAFSVLFALAVAGWQVWCLAAAAWGSGATPG